MFGGTADLFVKVNDLCVAVFLDRDRSISAKLTLTTFILPKELPHCVSIFQILNMKSVRCSSGDVKQHTVSALKA